MSSVVDDPAVQWPPSSSPLLTARDLERRRAQLRQEFQDRINRLITQLLQTSNDYRVWQQRGEPATSWHGMSSTNKTKLGAPSRLDPVISSDSEHREDTLAVASVRVGAGTTPGSTLETPKSRTLIGEMRAPYNTPDGPPAHRLKGKDKETVLDGMWINRRCALLHGKGGLEVAHLVAFSISDNEREKLERAMGIMDGGLNINTRSNLIEVCQTVHGLIDGQHGVLIPRRIVASRVKAISPPNPPVSRYEDLPYLDGEREVVREYFYVCLDHKDNIDEGNLLMGRTAITPDPRTEFERTLQDTGNASLGFVRASDLPSDFSLVQPLRLEQVSAWTTMPRAYLNVNPVFVMLNAGKTLYNIQRLNPGRKFLPELLERFAGTDDEQYVGEVYQVLALCRSFYQMCFIDDQDKKRNDASFDVRDASYIPRHNSPPSSDTQDTPPNSSPLAPVRTQYPYKEKLRRNRPEEGRFRESSVDAEPLDFTVYSDEEPSSPPAQEAVPVPPEVVNSVDPPPRSGKRPLQPQSSASNPFEQCKTLLFSLTDFMLNEDAEPPASHQGLPYFSTGLAYGQHGKGVLPPPNEEDGVGVGVFVEDGDGGDEEVREED
ncbi:hypothetical protein FISHEDRAFT_59031 [Fistulina hepatica ATCC 64428]|uniref:Uncharacterized protein n=1 Tax=Fistulina hepatica ATCC 64428 TaxID=1128425 RepID=A0A0D7ABI7_9AGAR|nr:hypothetical protein FISHEDRAFT_59031 [Fistulina hepatica ATCC 64428]